MNSRRIGFVSVALAAAGLGVGTAAARDGDGRKPKAKHVLLLSIDGLHASDLADYVGSHPSSALAQLSGHGVTYQQASTSKPSDSFPGLISMITGGSPASTGVYYDDSYDRLLLPPNLDADGNPLGGNTPGTETEYDETIDFDLTRPDAGGGINPDRLPRDPITGLGVYPHEFLRVNTIFEVAHLAQLRTAWCDKHPAYELVNGPSGVGVDDLFCPEVNSYTPESADSTHVVNTSSLQGIENYDDTKVAAILNEIAGFDHTGKGRRVGTPAVFGMNFQAVSVGQKLIGNVNADGSAPSDPAMVNGGYVIDVDTGTPVPSPMLANALDHTDASIGSMLSALEKAGLTGSTVVIVTAKHGQSPIDPSKLKSGLTGFKLKNALSNLITPVATIAQLTEDDVGLIWLAQQDQTDAATKALQAGQAGAFIQKIYSGTSLKLVFPDPATDSRVPDIIVQPELGVIYSNSTAKDAEHGGFTVDDVNVALIVSGPDLGAASVQSPVETTQIAPTILQLLNLDPSKLQSVRSEKTTALPGLF